MKVKFSENELHVFNRPDNDQMKRDFDRFVERTKGEIEAWSERGSGWVIERIMQAYVSHQPLLAGTYLDLPQKLKSKKTITNVRNRDNEYLKLALRAALFPAKDAKDQQRPRKYPVDVGITFPTPVEQIDNLEAQDRNFAVNVFGWENDYVLVYKLSINFLLKNVIVYKFMEDPSHKLHDLLPPRNESTYWTRSLGYFELPICKTHRFRKTFIMNHSFNYN